MSLFSTPCVSDAHGPAPEIEISIRMGQPWTHYFEVDILVSGVSHDALDFVMPVWTPGSYLVREFARNVQEFSATDGGGKKLNWEKTNKNTWRVHSRQAPKIVLHYRVYAFEISVRTSFLDDTHGYINGASVFMYVEGYLRSPIRVKINPFPGWTRISTPLDPIEGSIDTFHAPDFDTLVDSPIEIGNQRILDFTVREIPHVISIYGEGNYEPEKLRSDIKKIVEAAVEMIGEMPYRRYIFIIHLLAEGSGGLEHLNSTSLQVSRWIFQPEERYRRFLELLAHEFFHLWNGKRIRPESLGPFDYTAENYTRMLWVYEGFTSYFGDHIVRRSGLITADQYLEGVSKVIKGYCETPGRLVESAAEASFDAWIKYYRRDEHSPNATISYYTKGQLIALIMDLEIRHRTARLKSLDDVMRLLYTRFYRQLQRGYSEQDFRTACEEIAGTPVEEIFDAYVYGTAEIDFAHYLAYAGLQFAEPKRDEKTLPKGYMGISTKILDGKLIISGVPTGTPGYNHGLSLNDEILAVDGYRVNQETFTARIEEKKPGTRVEVTVARDGRLRTIPVVLGENTAAEFKLTRISDPTPEQKQLYESWLSAAWE